MREKKGMSVRTRDRERVRMREKAPCSSGWCRLTSCESRYLVSFSPSRCFLMVLALIIWLARNIFFSTCPIRMNSAKKGAHFMPPVRFLSNFLTTNPASALVRWRSKILLRRSRNNAGWRESHSNPFTYSRRKRTKRTKKRKKRKRKKEKRRKRMGRKEKRRGGREWDERRRKRKESRRRKEGKERMG